ncbi:MAG: DUF418 domain-containing protein [Endozoicomonadaceae bacterium]|nr:DUF418 domain-containing protein [Endozoicomonadaceae bacterium]
MHLGTTPEEKVTQTQRLDTVDALRGFALTGVCFVHMMTQYYAGRAPAVMADVASTGLINQILDGAVGALFVGKFYLLFSLLFGLSFFIQMDNAEKKARKFEGLFLWRLMLLFGFGVIHHYFFRGDILTTFAVLGVFLLLFNRLSTKVIVGITALLLLGAGRYIGLLLFDGISPFDTLDIDPSSTKNLAYFEVVKNGGLLDTFTTNRPIKLLETADFQLSVFGRGYITLGLFTLGLCLGRWGVFHKLEEHRALLSRLLKWSFALSILLILTTIGAFSQAPQPIDFGTWYAALCLTLYDLFNLALSLFFSCIFLLVTLKQKSGKLIGIFAPYGRMALSNYMFQAVIGTFIFYGWGLGLMAELPNIVIAPIAICVIVLQLYLSNIWMQHFHFGPLEWLWRSATQRKLCTLRKIRID